MGLRLGGALERRRRSCTARSAARCSRGCGRDVAVDEVPIGSITNGVHARTLGRRRVSTRCSAARVGDDCGTAPTPSAGRRVRDLDPAEVWATLRGRAATSWSASCAAALGGDVLDPDALTIGFARRFATYKRATLLLSQPERLQRAAARRRAAGAVRVRRQGPPGRQAGQGADPARSSSSPASSTSATASCSSPTTTWRSPGRCTTAATCG